MVVPKRNLSPEAEPWGRSVDDAITQLQRDVVKNAQDNSNAFAGIASSMQALSKQIADINTQQATIAAQQATILSLLGKTVRAGQNGLTTTGFTVNPTLSAVSSCTIPIPSGFNSAAVFCSAHASIYNSQSSAYDYLYVGAQINGIGPALIEAEIDAQKIVSSGGSASRILSGLSGGSITISSMVKTGTYTFGPVGGTIATVDGIAIFYNV